MFVGTLFALFSDTTCFGESRKVTPYSIPRYVPLLNDLFQSVLWSASVVHGSSMSYMARSSKVAVFLMSKAAEAVGVKGICSVGSVGKGTFFANLICGCIGIVTVFVENETHSDQVFGSLGRKGVVGSPYELHVYGFVWTSWKKTLHIRDHLPNVPFDRKHDIRFLLSVL